MEREPLQPGHPEGTPESKDKKRKNRKRKFVAPIPVETDAPDTAATSDETSARSLSDEALAQLAATRKNATEQSETDAPGQNAESTPDTESDTAATAESEDTESYEPLVDYKLEPTEFSGGEVIVQLQGDEPVAERVIPLHQPAVESLAETETPAADESSASSEAAASTAVPEFVPLPQQQPQAHGGETPLPVANPDAPLPAPAPEATPVAHAELPPQPIQAEVFPPDNPVATAETAVATKQDVEDALYRATRVGEHRGALSGLLVGGAVEHFMHKGREKRMARRFERQTRQLKQQQETTQLYQTEQHRQHAEQGRQLEAVERRLDTTPPAPEQLARQSSDERLAVPDDHRLETSAWHTIEVDAKTGKAVEKPTFEYGHEYYRERAAEAAPMQQRNAAAGEVALVAAAGGGTDSNGTPDIPDASTQGPPPHQQKQQTARPAHKATDAVHAAATGPLWPWVVALVVLIVCLLLVLH